MAEHDESEVTPKSSTEKAPSPPPKAKRPDPQAEQRNTLARPARPLSPAEQDRIHRHGKPQ